MKVMAGSKLPSAIIPRQAISTHTTRQSCWLVIRDQVYDVTGFLPHHPGGAEVILETAGRDATAAFEAVHNLDLLRAYTVTDDEEEEEGNEEEKEGMCRLLGVVEGGGEARTKKEKKDRDDADANADAREVAVVSERETQVVTGKDKSNSTPWRKPALEECLNLDDFEDVARRVMSEAAWAYYSSGADDEVTMHANRSAYRQIRFRPRVLRNVEVIDTSTTMLGSRVALPFYVTATALGKLGHPEGEVVLTRAARKFGVAQMIPTLASCGFDEIVDAAGDVIDGGHGSGKKERQMQWLQLYVNKNRTITRRIVQHAEKRGCKGLFVTVDAPQLGRRERDMRLKYTGAASSVQQKQQQQQQQQKKSQIPSSPSSQKAIPAPPRDNNDTTAPPNTNPNSNNNNITTNSNSNTQGASRAISTFIDPSLSWRDLAWLRSITNLPILLKGVQRAEDGLRAAELGLAGIVISNHGGRQLDHARPAVDVLREVMPVLRARGYMKNRHHHLNHHHRDNHDNHDDHDDTSSSSPSFEVYTDGGIRRATDILKALCLGARGVGIGRPFLYAMGAYGQAGVERAMALLRDELVMDMRLLGVASVQETGLVGNESGSGSGSDGGGGGMEFLDFVNDSGSGNGNGIGLKRFAKL